VVDTAKTEGLKRFNQAKQAAVNKLKKDWNDAKLMAKEASDKADEGARGLGKYIFPQDNLALQGAGGGYMNIEDSGKIISGTTGNSSASNLKNIEEFVKGNKNFEEVLEEYADIYAEKIKSNEPWSWGEDILGSENLTLKQKRLIKEKAISNGSIPQITINKVDGMRYGFADFAGAGLVEETVYLPKEFWKLPDKKQFSWLDNQIGGHREGMTWHHTEIPGKMELVPYGIHNITPHNGGRTTGMWADAPR